jgi:phage tail sheath protein FI
MPITPTYPGVYIEEIPSGVRTIAGVATSITAFVGRAKQGPVDEPTTVFSFGEYERKFGGLWLDSPMSYSVRDFFQNGGGQAIIVRVQSGGTRAAWTFTGFFTLQAANEGAWPNDYVVSVTVPGATDVAAIEVADSQGVDPGDLFHVSVLASSASGAAVLESFKNVTLVDGPRRLDKVLANGSQILRFSGTITTSVTPTASSTASATAGTDGSAVTASNVLGSESGKTGMYALEKADLFNLLVIPPSSWARTSPRRAGMTRPATVSLAVRSCSSIRRSWRTSPSPTRCFPPATPPPPS